MIALLLAVALAAPTPPYPEITNNGTVIGRPGKVNLDGGVSCTGSSAGATCNVTGGGGSPGGSDGDVQLKNGTNFQGAPIPDCTSSSSKLLYNATTKTFSCGTDLSGLNTATGTLAFGAEGADNELATTTLTAAWVSAGQTLLCNFTDSTDHAHTDDDRWVEGANMVYTITAGVSIGIEAHASNFTFGTWGVECVGL